MSGEREEWPAPEAYAWELPDTGMAGEVGKCRHADDLYVRTEESPDDSTTSCMSPLQARKAGLTLLRAAAHLGDEEAREVLWAANNADVVAEEVYMKLAALKETQELALEQGRREERERWTTQIHKSQRELKRLKDDEWRHGYGDALLDLAENIGIDNDCDDAEPAPTPEPEAAEARHNHAIDETGQCKHWCEACRANVRAGLAADGSEPEAADEAGEDNDCETARLHIKSDDGFDFRECRKTRNAEACRMSVPFTVRTLEGTMEGKAGDYLMRGAMGELYPCAADVFDSTYVWADACDNDSDATTYTADDARWDLTVATGHKYRLWRRFDAYTEIDIDGGRFPWIALFDDGRAEVIWGLRKQGDRMSLRDAVRAIVEAERRDSLRTLVLWPKHDRGRFTELRCGLWVPVREDSGTVEECDPNAELRAELAALRERVDEQEGWITMLADTTQGSMVPVVIRYGARVIDAIREAQAARKARGAGAKRGGLGDA